MRAVVQCAERRRARSRPMRRAQTSAQSSNAQNADERAVGPMQARPSRPCSQTTRTRQRDAMQKAPRAVVRCRRHGRAGAAVPCAHDRPVRDVQRLFHAHSFPCPCDEQLPSPHARLCPVCLIAPIRQEKRDRHPMRYTRAHAGPWAHKGDVYRKANWTAKVQASHAPPMPRQFPMGLPWASHEPVRPSHAHGHPMPLPCPGNFPWASHGPPMPRRFSGPVCASVDSPMGPPHEPCARACRTGYRAF